MSHAGRAALKISQLVESSVPYSWKLGRARGRGQICSIQKNLRILNSQLRVEGTVNAKNTLAGEQAVAFMFKLRWDIKEGKVADFKSNQKALCKVMLEHPGVICYHVEYPSESVSEWVEIYANDDAFSRSSRQ